MSIELNIDGLVGPTHNYAGLSYGNLASQNNHGQRSNPRKAALQGLHKMRVLLKMGLSQAIMPPQERPFLPALRALGFSGSDKNLIENAWTTNPSLAANLSSASSMWAANAATISPSIDCKDNKVHISTANLSAMPHRSIEAPMTHKYLRVLFNNSHYFKVHEALPCNDLLGDEGAANHNRLASHHGASGLEIFVHGRNALMRANTSTQFPGRQTLEASEAITRRHQLRPYRVIHVKQSALAVDAGAFHNDVVCVTNGPVFLHHEDAFDDLHGLKANIRSKTKALQFEPIFIQASRMDMPIADAIKSYFFNSQLLTMSDGNMALILPSDAQEVPSAHNFAQSCVQGDNPITKTIFLDVRESMRNGGGPACLRLRAQLTKPEFSSLHQPSIMTEEKLDRLETWVNRYYRDRLDPADLCDPNLLEETQLALNELTNILELGSFYHFQNGTIDNFKAE